MSFSRRNFNKPLGVCYSPGVISERALKNGGFFFAAEPRHMEINRHFLENEYGDLSFFLLF